MKSLCAAGECVDVGNVAVPRPGIVSACSIHVEMGRSKRKRKIFLMRGFAPEQGRFVISPPD